MSKNIKLPLRSSSVSPLQPVAAGVRNALRLPLYAALAVMPVGLAQAEGLPVEFDLLDLYRLDADGSRGTVLGGYFERQIYTGGAVSILGDFNGDPFDDLLVSSSGYNVTHIIFGTDQGFPADISLSGVANGDGSTGFALSGTTRYQAHGGVGRAGDVNGDGLMDVIVGEAYSPAGRPFAGGAVVVFGSDQGFPADFDTAALAPANGGDGTAGFVIAGASASDEAGTGAAAAGDMNGDGVDDLVLATRAGTSGGGDPTGEVYVLFGREESFPAAVDLADLLPANGGDGSAGFVLNGIAPGDYVGTSYHEGAASAAGDLNGDGIGDLIMGARNADAGAGAYAGQAYVIFGKDDGFAPVNELSALLPANQGDGSAGFVINGVAASDGLGHTVGAAGDINGDGLDDAFVGTRRADGDLYIIFGTTDGFLPVIEAADLLAANGGDGSVGMVMRGGLENGRSNASVAGDMNRDGISDLLVGQPGAAPGGPGTEPGGAAYLVFGKAGGFGAEFDLQSLSIANGGDGSEGISFAGPNDTNYYGGTGVGTGAALSGGGDVNGDGLDDLLIGDQNFENYLGREQAGVAYLIFGQADPEPVGVEVRGVDTRVVLCLNQADGQRVLAPFPGTELRVEVDCEALGLQVASGEGVLMYAAATGVALPQAMFSGITRGLATGATARCRNLTQGGSVSVPIGADGVWNCSAAGLPIAPSDEVVAIVLGVAE